MGKTGYVLLTILCVSCGDKKAAEKHDAEPEDPKPPARSATPNKSSASSAAPVAVRTEPSDPQAVACTGGDLPACVKYADTLLKGSDKAAKRGCEAPLRKACDGNVGRACSDLGSRCLPAIILADGRKTFIADKKAKAELNEKACGLNDGLGCFNIAKDYEEGFGVVADEAKAGELMKKALSLLPKECDAGDGKSCFALAMLYNPSTASTRVPKDDAKSKQFYKKACEAGEEMACNVVTK